MDASPIRRAWWTRTQRIRTAGAFPCEIVFVDAKPTPVYQRIAAKAAHLHELGLSPWAIGHKLGVTNKTVAKALAWLTRMATR